MINNCTLLGIHIVQKVHEHLQSESGLQDECHVEMCLES